MSGAKPRTDRQRAKRLVQRYLNDCGGEPSGFDFGEQEEALQIAIERELGRVRREAKPPRPARPSRKGKPWDGMAPCGVHGADYQGQPCGVRSCPGRNGAGR